MRIFLALAIASVGAVSAWAAAGDTTPTVRLIPRAILFGNPSRADAKLSPDGKWLSWAAPKDGVLNVWVAPADNPSQARAMTDEKSRPVSGYRWSRDSSMILYSADNNGDENFLLYGVDVASGARKSLTPFQKARVGILASSRKIKDRILIVANNRDPRFFDVYSLNLKSGALTLVMQNDGGFRDYMADENLDLRIAQKTRPDAGKDFYRVVDGKVEDQPFETIGAEDAARTWPADFSGDGKILYWIDSRGRDTSALIAQNLSTGQKTVLGQDPKADIGGYVYNPSTGKVDAYTIDYLKSEWIALDPAMAADIAFLKARLKGEIGIGSRTDADDAWIVSDSSASAPSSVYRYDRKAKTLTKLFVTQPKLEGAPLVEMRPVEIKSRDGLTLVSYLSLPPGSDPKGDGRPDRPLPIVLVVHGGPHARDEYGFNVYHQWLANRGYAVLSVNFRGSTGFGKAFFAAANLQWGAKMHDDLLDAVDWAVREGIADAKKVAIFGGSYGGYATLVALAFTPDRFACGVDEVGPSNLSTLLASIPPYWAPELAALIQEIGDPATPAGRALLHDRSPLFKADAIKVPLLIGQGAHDPRVNQAEADQIAAALKGKNIPVTYVLFPDEGHGFARPENNIAFLAVAEQFLSKCLGGRAEAIGDALAPSSAIVKMGADYVPGLAAALAAKAAVGKP